MTASNQENKTRTNIAKCAKFATPNSRFRIRCDLMRNEQQDTIAFGAQIDLISATASAGAELLVRERRLERATLERTTDLGERMACSGR
jgi:hypothetical protein